MKLIQPSQPVGSGFDATSVEEGAWGKVRLGPPRIRSLELLFNPDGKNDLKPFRTRRHENL